MPGTDSKLLSTTITIDTEWENGKQLHEIFELDTEKIFEIVTEDPDDILPGEAYSQGVTLKFWCKTKKE